MSGGIQIALAAVAIAGTGAVAAEARPAAADSVRASSAKAPAKGGVQKITVSPNWSGYVATSPPGRTISYTSVTGTWTVPEAHCDGLKAGTYSTVWVGLGGYKYEKQEEIGTDSNCSADGKASYYAWFEVVPYLSFPTDIKDKIYPGDTVTGLVKILKKAKRVQLTMKNRTRGWTFTTKISWPEPDTTSADWVASAPATCKLYTCTEASLTNFGTVTMRDISAVGDSKVGTLKNPDWKVIPIKLVPSRMKVPTLNPDAPTTKKGRAASPAGATPGKLTADGRSFKLKWIKVATGGL